MTTITALRPRTDLARSRSPTERDDAQQLASFLQQTRLLTEACSRQLDYHPQQQLTIKRVIDRLTSEHTRTPTRCVPAKSP